MSERGCEVTGWKPEVWKDDDGWRCDQNVMCWKCDGVWTNTLAEDVTWAEAMAAVSGRAPYAAALRVAAGTPTPLFGICPDCNVAGGHYPTCPARTPTHHTTEEETQ